MGRLPTPGWKVKERGHIMTLSRRPIRTWAVAAALIFATLPLFARSGRELRIGSDAVLQGQLLPIGSYRLSWKPNGRPDEVELAILDGKKVVASATAKWVDRATRSDYDSIVYRSGPKGTQTIVEIRFAGKRQVMRVTE